MSTLSKHASRFSSRPINKTPYMLYAYELYV